MGKDKKHKRHRLDKRHEDPASGRLRLVLKVGGAGGAGSGADTPDRPSPAATPPQMPSVAPLRVKMTTLGAAQTTGLSTADQQRVKDKKHKKKKKKDRDRDKQRHKDRHRRDRHRMDSTGSVVGGGYSTEQLRRLSSTSDFKTAVGAPSVSRHVSMETDSTDPAPPPPAPQYVPVQPIAESAAQPAAVADSCAAPAAGGQLLDLLQLGPDTDTRPHRTPLQRFLEYVLKGLEKKDVHVFFAAPVTDALAPGYSSIITQPMDFSTMRQKNDDAHYQDLPAFQEDFRLMCANAMVYNRMDTKYYKAAKRLLHVGTKMMHPDKLAGLQTVLPYMNALSSEQLGFDLDEYTAEDVQDAGRAAAAAPADELPFVKLCRLEGAATTGGVTGTTAPDEDAEAAAILEQARSAARTAASRLVQRARTPPKLGFLRQRPDGTTSLAILTPGTGENSDRMEKPLSVGLLTGKLSQGSAQLATFKEDKRNVAKPVKPLYYGPYSSFAPSYDSTFANLTPEESELLFQTYGDETGQQYAESVRRFAAGCEPAVEMVEGLLELLTDGQHGRTLAALQEQRQLVADESSVGSAMASALQTAASVGDSTTREQQPIKDQMASLRSLSQLGIDVSFLDAAEEEERRQRQIQQKLSSTADLIRTLNDVQSRRLSMPPSAAPNSAETEPIMPSSNEIQLADQLKGSLSEMMRHARPGDISSVPALRKAMGVGPIGRSDAIAFDNPSSQEEVDVEGVSTVSPSSQHPQHCTSC